MRFSHLNIVSGLPSIAIVAVYRDDYVPIRITALTAGIGWRPFI